MFSILAIVEALRITKRHVNVIERRDHPQDVTAVILLVEGQQEQVVGRWSGCNQPTQHCDEQRRVNRRWPRFTVVCSLVVYNEVGGRAVELSGLPFPEILPGFPTCIAERRHTTRATRMQSLRPKTYDADLRRQNLRELVGVVAGGVIAVSVVLLPVSRISERSHAFCD